MNNTNIVNLFLFFLLTGAVCAESKAEGNLLRGTWKSEEIELRQVYLIQSDVFMNTPEEIIIENDRMYISLRGEPKDGNERDRKQSGITIWDIREIARPKLLCKFSHPALQGGMDHIRLGQVLFLQSLYNATLFSIDITNITAPQLLDTLRLGRGQAIAYRLCKIPGQDRLVVSIYTKQESSAGEAEAIGEVAIIDVSDPGNLRIADKQIEPDTWSYDNFATGKAVYSFPYLKGNRKLNIYEIMPAGTLCFRKRLTNPLLDGVHYFQEDSLLTIANFGTATILTLNIRDPFNPHIIGHLQDRRLGNPNRIAPDRHHQLLWVAGFRENIISVIDVSNPQRPSFIKSFTHELFNCVQTIACYKNHLFVGSRDTNSTIIFRVDIRK